MQIAIANQRARQQSGFTKNLKTVADSEYEASAFGKLLHRIHHRRKPRERSGSQVVTVRKPTRNDHRVVRAQVGLPMPDKINRLAYGFLDHVGRRVVAISTGKNYNPKLHPSISTR